MRFKIRSNRPGAFAAGASIGVGDIGWMIMSAETASAFRQSGEKTPVIPGRHSRLMYGGLVGLPPEGLKPTPYAN